MNNFPARPAAGKQVPPSLLGAAPVTPKLTPAELAAIAEKTKLAEIETVKMPTPEDFFLNSPLYKKHPITDYTKRRLLSIRNFTGHLDCYCIGCKRHSTFTRVGETYIRNLSEVTTTGNYDVTFECSRDRGHLIYFVYVVDADSLSKIGQNPSLATLATADIKDYRRVLSEEKQIEFSKAVGLVSHGVGIGAFVYLRRIFESLVEEAHNKARSAPGWDEEDFQRDRMDGKIGRLKEHLPDFLHENRKLYGILSQGIHELTEDQCLEAFPAVRVGIELILDEKLVEAEKQEKIMKARAAIGALGSKLGTKKIEETPKAS
jgi:hypothetical protein